MRLIGADEVEDEVRATSVGQLAYRIGSLDHLVGAELRREPPPPLVGVDGDHRARPQLADELQRDVPDAADTDDDRRRARERRDARRRLTAW